MRRERRHLAFVTARRLDLEEQAVKGIGQRADLGRSTPRIDGAHIVRVAPREVPGHQVQGAQAPPEAHPDQHPEKRHDEERGRDEAHDEVGDEALA